MKTVEVIALAEEKNIDTVVGEIQTSQEIVEEIVKEERKARKTYLGDSVYVAMDEYGAVVLTTENGDRYPTNRIFLESGVLEALQNWLRQQSLLPDLSELANANIELSPIGKYSAPG